MTKPKTIVEQLDKLIQGVRQVLIEEHKLSAESVGPIIEAIAHCSFARVKLDVAELLEKNDYTHEAIALLTAVDLHYTAAQNALASLPLPSGEE